ncbi:MAG: cytochrome c oxidase accessory protein CcoG [Azospirillum sp.]|nr:cytochrome c oxidase accessory protein CcoG [Azospirillum sp.]
MNSLVSRRDIALVGSSSATAPGSLWADHQKIHPKTVSGQYRSLKWAILVALMAAYYILPWLRWDRGMGAPDQAVLVDFATERFYFFFIELWPQQIYYLTGALILAALALFLATTLFGRVWCGFACPQTLWTDLFQWVERRIEGDRGERIRLDAAPWSARKLGRRVAKHSAWLAISLTTGGAWVLYFYDAPTFFQDVMSLQVPQTTMFFIALFSGTTYLLGGIAREQFCLYACPWPRFQASLQDEDSLVVTFQAWRGEGRRRLDKRQSWSERKAAGGGDCIDCGVCHQVCPTGIDIRQGIQMGCISCGLCVDGCNSVMSRIGRPGNLIAFDTERNQTAQAAGQPASRFRLWRPRTVAYGALIAATAALIVIGLLFQPHLEVSVQRDRAPMFVTLANGDIRNGYTIKISNMTRQIRKYTLAVDGLPEATLAVAGQDGGSRTVVDLSAAPDTVTSYRVLVQAPRLTLRGAATPLDFHLAATRGGETAVYDSVFMGPEG